MLAIVPSTKLHPCWRCKHMTKVLFIDSNTPDQGLCRHCIKWCLEQMEEMEFVTMGKFIFEEERNDNT